MLALPDVAILRGTYKILDCMRLAYEPLLLEAQVDVVFNGHVHVSAGSASLYSK